MSEKQARVAELGLEVEAGGPASEELERLTATAQIAAPILHADLTDRNASRPLKSIQTSDGSPFGCCGNGPLHTTGTQTTGELSHASDVSLRRAWARAGAPRAVEAASDHWLDQWSNLAGLVT